MHSATYNLHDDKLKLYLDQSQRIPREEFDALRELGLAWWRGSKCFAGVWSPEREDAVLQYVEEIEFIVDDDSGLVYRLERFGRYAGNAQARAAGEQARIDSISEGIPPGQPIIVGHHSEQKARRVQKQLDGAMRRMTWEQDKADYWGWRQERAGKHAAYQERPDVIRRRIEGYEAELRKKQREANRDTWRVWNREATEEGWQRHLRWHQRWVEHLEMALDYQRMLYERSGGVPYDRGEIRLEVGGAIMNRYPARWLPIIKVNPKTVTVPDTYRWDAFTPLGDGKGTVFTRTVNKADITRALTRAEYEQHEHYAIGQQLLAALVVKTEARVPVEKGGAIKFRYYTGGGASDWLPVIRVNQKTVTVRKWSPYDHRWWEDKVYKTHIAESMSARDWADYVAGQKKTGDERWEKLSRPTK